MQPVRQEATRVGVGLQQCRNVERAMVRTSSAAARVKKGDVEVLGDWLRLVFGEVAANIVDIIVCFQGAFLMFQIFGGGTWA